MRRDACLSSRELKAAASYVVGSLTEWHVGISQPQIVQSVAFTGDGLEGIPLKHYYDDSNGNNVRDYGETIGDTPIVGPEYDRDSGANKWALEQVGTQFHVAVTFQLDEQAFPSSSTVQAWADATNSAFDLNSESSPITLTSLGNGLWSGTFQVNQAPSQIGDNSVTWTWHIDAGLAEVTQQTSNTILTSLGSSDDPGPDNHGEDAELSDSSTPFALAAAQAPTTQQVDADLAKWASDAAQGLTGDENILNAFIKRENLVKLGKYIYPPPELIQGSPFDKHSKEALICYKQGACGNWAEMFAAAATLQNVTVTRDGFSVRKVDNPNINDWSIGFTTKQLTPVGGAAPRTYEFSDHEWVEYGNNRTIYDPSFAVVYKLADAPPDTTAPKLWKAYALNALMDGNKFWLRKPSSLPNNAWLPIGEGGDMTKAVQVAPVAQGQLPHYALYTYSDRWGKENPDHGFPGWQGDQVILLGLSDPPAGA